MGRSNLRARKPSGAYTIVDVKRDTVFFIEHTPGASAKPPWQALPLGLWDFSSDTSRYQRPDYSVNSSYPGIRTRWTYNTGYTVASTPAVWKDYVVTGNSSGTVYCNSLRNGSLLWKFKTGGPVYSTPDAIDGKVVFGSAERNIYCLDIGKGRLLWKVRTGAPVVAAATITKGVVYIGGRSGHRK